MAKFSAKLWNVLQELQDDEFKKFKWFLKQDDVSAARLEKADRQDTVDLMAQKYGGTGAMKETMTIFEKISRNDLVQDLKNSCPDPKDIRPLDLGVLREDYERKPAELKDPDPANLNPLRSGEQLHCVDLGRRLLNDPERFYRCVCWSDQRTDRQEGTNQSEP